MTDANVTNTTVTQAPGRLFVSETERKCVLSHEVLASGDFPPSLISYLQTSNSRAALCEKLILEEVEDLTTSYEDLMNPPSELFNNMLTLNQQDKENENTSADSCLLPETGASVTTYVTASPRKEDETETDDDGESEKFSLTKEEIKENNEHQQAHKEKRHFEELKKEEQIRQRENDFQMELKKLVEAEKLHQIELQLMEKRAQEKLDQELLLQQELISNLQKQVEEERRMMAEELKRMKEEEEKKRKEEEEDRKKIEEEKIKRENQRMEEEIIRKKMEEENKKILEMRAEEERRLKEQQRKREEEEERRKREEVRIKMEEEKRKREEEEDRKRREEEEMKREMQRRKMEDEMRRKKEEDRKITEVELRTKEEEEEKTKREEEKGKVEEEMMKNKAETKTDECNKKIWLKEEKMEQVERETNAKKMENKSNPKVQKEEEKAGKTVMKVTGKNNERSKEKTNEEDIRQIKEWRKEEGKARLTENERRDAEVTKELEVRTRHEEEMKENKPEEARRETMTTEREEEEQRKVDGTQLSEDKGKRRKTQVIRKEEEKIKQEEWRKRQEEENDDHRNMEEEVRSKEEKEHEAKIRKVEDHRNRTEREKQEKKSEEEVMENQEETLEADGRRHHEEEGSKMIREQEEMVSRSSDLQDKKRSNSRTEGGTTGSGSQTWSSGAWVEQQLCSASSCPPLCPAEQKRLSWMNACISWSKLSLQSRRKQRGSLRGGRLPRRLPRRPEGSGPPPLGPHALLQATGCRSFQQLTSVTLEDLPGCHASSLAPCSHLQSLTLRRCGLTALEGLSHLSQLCYIDVTENGISFVDCEDMSSLRVLRLGYNKLTSIHGLRGADNLDELELSHNNITRIAGLESMRRLQRLSVDHNQLVSTKGLRDVYTLLHLNCSHNHLAGVEGLENNVLLKTLDLGSNSLPEAPGLDDHVLLRELRLDDNSISSLQALAAACWLPLMQNLSVAQNRITRLPSMSDFVSLVNLDLQFNCMSELHNVCESLEGCLYLQHVHLRGNPLQQENGWRSTLQKALPGLRAIDDQQTDCLLSPPAVQRISSASDTFLSFCQAQLQQMNDLLQQHSRELSEASSSLDAVKSLCRHFTDTLQLAEDHRFAHECGDFTASEGRTDLQSTAATKLIVDAQTESSETVPAVGPSRNNVNSSWTCETPPTWLQSSDAGTKETGLNSLSQERTTSSSDCHRAALSDQDLDHKNSADAVIQQQCRQNHGDISWRPLAASGDGANPEPGPSCVTHCVVDQHDAAAVIQASWRGFSVRRRLASALAAVTFPSTREDDTLEEVDMDEFVFDEAELEKHWTLQLSDDLLSRHEPVSEQPPSPEPLPEPSHNTHPTLPVWRPKQAWVPEGEVDPAGRDSPESSHRKSPASSSVLSGISERSEKILEEWGFTDSHTALQMLKRAQNMKWKQQRKKKHKDLPVAALFDQLVPVEAGNRAAPHRNQRRGALCRTEQQPERTQPLKQDSAQQRLHGQPDRSSDSERFLPELSSDVLSGGRVQLVADPAFSERHRASGQRASSASSAQQHRGYPPRISLGQATADAPSPNRVAAAPTIKERISFRDNAVQLSGGWGGGKKRSRTK